MMGRVPAALLFAALLSACSGREPIPGEVRRTEDGYRTGAADAVRRESPKILETMRKNRIPGLGIVIVGQDGGVGTAGFGTVDGNGSRAVDPGTIFSIQSMSKTFTAIAVMTAVRDGLLELDAPIVTYLPDFTVRSIWEPDPGKKLTLRHLLTCTAGFTHEAPSGNNFSPALPSPAEHARSIMDTWLRYPVGACYAYSNLGFDLAAYILETVSGVPFPRYMKEKVFEPLGMTRTTVDYGEITAESNRAIGHMNHCISFPVEVPMIGAGGVYTCADDLAKFLQFELSGGLTESGELLSPRLFRELTRPPVGSDYALGIAAGKLGTDLFLTHSGGGYGFLSHMAWYPAYGIGIAVLTNASDHGTAHIELADSIIGDILSDPLTVRLRSLPYLPTCDITVHTLNQVLGYRFARDREALLYRPEWKRYEGRYAYSLNVKLTGWANLLASFGIGVPGIRVLHRGDGFYLTENDVEVRLREQDPGFFFTETGEALDFRNTPPTYRNIRLVKH